MFISLACSFNSTAGPAYECVARPFHTWSDRIAPSARFNCRNIAVGDVMVGRMAQITHTVLCQSPPTLPSIAQVLANVHVKHMKIPGNGEMTGLCCVLHMKLQHYLLKFFRI